MLRLRPYKPCDAETVIGWCRDQKTYQLWGGELIGPYPLTADKLNEVYFARNGLCAEPDNFYPMMACDENGPAGHFIIRYPTGDPRVLRLGWVIVDTEALIVPPYQFLFLVSCINRGIKTSINITIVQACIHTIFFFTNPQLFYIIVKSYGHEGERLLFPVQRAARVVEARRGRAGRSLRSQGG